MSLTDKHPPALPAALAALVAFHVLVIIVSNYLVQLPVMIGGWHTTWGAFSFPLIFLATDLTVRLLGKAPARQVVMRVMGPALLASYAVSVLFHEAVFQGFAALLSFNTFVFRIALASFLAYLCGQMLDIQVFNRLRQRGWWWLAPGAAAVVSSLLDTFVFYAVAFWRSDDAFMAANWVEMAAVDYVIKLIIMLLLMLPLYGAALKWLLSRLGVQPGFAPVASPCTSSR